MEGGEALNQALDTNISVLSDYSQNIVKKDLEPPAPEMCKTLQISVNNNMHTLYHIVFKTACVLLVVWLGKTWLTVTFVL